MERERAGYDEGCVFCTRRDQPEVLLETKSLYVMPDKFPLLPGHTLIISRKHVRCYGAASPELWPEVDETAGRVRQFLTAAYAPEVVGWENGVAGQTVYHAHLHLLPLGAGGLPAELDEHPEVLPVDGWEPVRRHFARHGGYRYVQVGGERRLIAGPGLIPPLETVRGWLCRVTGLECGPEGWVRATTPADVAELARRWGEWAGRR